MKTTVWGLVLAVICYGLEGERDFGQQAAPTKVENAPAPASAELSKPTDAASLVNEFLTALKARDFQTLYNLDKRCQDERNQIIEDQPQFIQQKKLDEAYNANKADFFRKDLGKFKTYWFLASLVDPEPKARIIEIDHVDPFDAYVELTYGSLETSVVGSAVFHGLTSFSGRLLKKVVVHLKFGAGKFQFAESVKDIDELWDFPKLKILAVDVDQTAMTGRMFVKFLGNVDQLKSVNAKIGDYSVVDHDIIRPTKELSNTIGILFDPDWLIKKSDYEGRNIPVSISITSNDEQIDTIWFEIIDMKQVRLDGNFVYLREPWRGFTSLVRPTDILAEGLDKLPGYSADEMRKIQGNITEQQAQIRDLLQKKGSISGKQTQEGTPSLVPYGSFVIRPESFESTTGQFTGQIEFDTPNGSMSLLSGREGPIYKIAGNLSEKTFIFKEVSSVRDMPGDKWEPWHARSYVFKVKGVRPFIGTSEDISGGAAALPYQVTLAL